MKPHTHLVQQAEDVVVVHQVGDALCCRPSGALEEAFTQLAEGQVEHGVDLANIAFPAVDVSISAVMCGLPTTDMSSDMPDPPDMSVEVHDELAHEIGHPLSAVVLILIEVGHQCSDTAAGGLSILHGCAQDHCSLCCPAVLVICKLGSLNCKTRCSSQCSRLGTCMWLPLQISS